MPMSNVSGGNNFCDVTILFIYYLFTVHNIYTIIYTPLSESHLYTNSIINIKNFIYIAFYLVLLSVSNLTDNIYRCFSTQHILQALG